MAAGDRIIVPCDDDQKLENSIITLYVGEEAARYTIHGKILAERSYDQFDESILLVSGNERFVDLSNVTRPVCELYLHFIQLGSIPLWQDKATTEEQNALREEVAVTLIELYRVGKMLSDKHTMDKAVSGIIEVFNGFDRPMLAVMPGVACITRVYDTTEPGSKLRLLMVNMYVRKACWAETIGHLPKSFLADLASAALKRVDDLEKGELRFKPALVQCMYHEHAIGERCPSRTTRKRKYSAAADNSPVVIDLDEVPQLEVATPYADGEVSDFGMALASTGALTGRLTGSPTRSRRHGEVADTRTATLHGDIRGVETSRAISEDIPACEEQPDVFSPGRRNKSV
ncbi:hypothetical protein CKM354_001073200 [Cercospora kikuchii]|uniref:BTB domain-containing protein n=1 Tax=Cercospora kikuchii TaxID=84275 RepID=A0A9P3CU52_9PEZI|nr:uncharacterized protein CKM354_001073200 [Cercospora kikuchii]GIZ47647.1 hypothetical protein CKM354_001073200 [Cercospora kikuchii]